MKWFCNNCLGEFIYWGLYVIFGGEWKGKVYNGVVEWLKLWVKVFVVDWLELMK